MPITRRVRDTPGRIAIAVRMPKPTSDSIATYNSTVRRSGSWNPETVPTPHR